MIIPQFNLDWYKAWKNIVLPFHVTWLGFPENLWGILKLLQYMYSTVWPSGSSLGGFETNYKTGALVWSLVLVTLTENRNTNNYRLRWIFPCENFAPIYFTPVLQKHVSISKKLCTNLNITLLKTRLFPRNSNVTLINIVGKNLSTVTFLPTAPPTDYIDVSNCKYWAYPAAKRWRSVVGLLVFFVIILTVILYQLNQPKLILLLRHHVQGGFQ